MPSPDTDPHHAASLACTSAEESPTWVTEDLIRVTLVVWQPYYKVPLTRDDAIGIILSAGRLFGALSGEATL